MRSAEQLSRLLQISTNYNSTAQLHSFLLRSGLLPSFAANLVSSYAKLPSISAARKLFDEIPNPTTFLHNTVLRAHSKSKQNLQCLLLFRHIKNPDHFTFPIALKASADLSALSHGRTIHGIVLRSPSSNPDPFVAAALIEFYSKCNEMDDAIKVFEEFHDPDVVMWTSVVTGYQKNGDSEAAVAFFSRMVVENGVGPDPVTVVSLVSALGQLADLRRGKSCHGFLVRFGLQQDLVLVNSVLNLYSKLGAVESAVRLFGAMGKRDVISWSCMIACFARNRKPVEALGVYKGMVEEGLEPNRITMISIIQACTLALDLQEGRRVHELAVHKGFELDAAISTSLIDMYMKCSCYEDAMDLFSRMGEKDTVAWAAVIGGCAQNGFPNESLKFFLSILSDGANIDAVMMVKVLAACSQLGILRQALCFHAHLVRSGFCGNSFVAAGLIDLYSKCGSLDDAVKVFEGARDKDVVLWSSMIDSYGVHGLGNEALTAFHRMVRSSVKPNRVTFVSVLSACSHSGLVEEGRRVFDRMNQVYGVCPDSEHCAIMVDLLGRCGELDEAMSLIKTMRGGSVKPDVWCALLAGCRVYQNIEMGEFVARNLIAMEPSHAGYYNLLCNMYAFDGKWDHVADVRSEIKDRGIKKTPGYSSLEVGSEVRRSESGGGGL